MKAGLGVLRTNSKAYDAFAYMNRAMFVQRSYADAAKDRKKGASVGPFVEPNLGDPVVKAKHQWRPFQMAFILQSLPEMVDRDGEHRDTVDLLWVPTGAGKTEAYLGLAAFAMVYRRLSAPSLARAAGVSVLMRYTLRLLTIQQFQRAATLLCACEWLRNGDSRSG